MHPPPEQRLDIAMLVTEFLGPLHIIADAGILHEVAVDIVLRLGPRNAELAGKTEGADAVDDTEIDGLRTPAHHRVHPLDWNAEHLRGGFRVNIKPLGEGLLQRSDIGDMGEDAQLDLRIVGADQLVARLGDKGFAELAPLLRSNGDVLYIRLG